MNYKWTETGYYIPRDGEYKGIKRIKVIKKEGIIYYTDYGKFGEDYFNLKFKKEIKKEIIKEENEKNVFSIQS